MPVEITREEPASQPPIWRIEIQDDVSGTDATVYAASDACRIPARDRLLYLRGHAYADRASVLALRDLCDQVLKADDERNGWGLGALFG